MSMQSIFVHLFGLAITFLVPMVVWLTLAAGLLQIAGKWVRRVSPALPHIRSLARKSAP